MPSLSDLLALADKSTIQTKIVELLRAAKFPAAAWQPFSMLRHFAETEPALLEDQAKAIALLAAAGYARTAPTAWQDMIGSDFFNEARKQAVYTEGTVILTDSAGVGPQSVSANVYWVGDAPGTTRFLVISGGTIPLNGSLAVTVRAEKAGASYNLGNGAISELLTSFPGISVSNPANPNGTWITQSGADVESNTAYAERMLDKWSTLGAGCDDPAYRYWASSSSAEIAKVKVTSPLGGQVRVYVAGALGLVSNAARDAARAVVYAKRPIGVPDVVVDHAAVVQQLIEVVLRVRPGYSPTVAVGRSQAGVDAYARSLPIGGGDGGLVSREKIIGALDIEDIDDMTLVNLAGDLTLEPNQVFVPTYAITTA